jgi:hypothetical protein
MSGDSISKQRVFWQKGVVTMQVSSFVLATWQSGQRGNTLSLKLPSLMANKVYLFKTLF